MDPGTLSSMHISWTDCTDDMGDIHNVEKEYHQDMDTMYNYRAVFHYNFATAKEQYYYYAVSEGSLQESFRKPALRRGLVDLSLVGLFFYALKELLLAYCSITSFLECVTNQNGSLPCINISERSGD